MATDYDAPRKTDDDSESIEALKERVPDKMSGVVDVDDADNPGGFELPGADLVAADHVVLVVTGIAEPVSLRVLMIMSADPETAPKDGEVFPHIGEPAVPEPDRQVTPGQVPD